MSQGNANEKTALVMPAMFVALTQQVPLAIALHYRNYESENEMVDFPELTNGLL